MIKEHVHSNAEVTVSTIPEPISECSQFGVAVTDSNSRIVHFEEKVSNPTPMSESPDYALVSMGNYVFETEVLLQALEKDAFDSESSHDFAKDILPKLCRTRRVYSYNFQRNKIPGAETKIT